MEEIRALVQREPVGVGSASMGASHASRSGTFGDHDIPYASVKFDRPLFQNTSDKVNEGQIQDYIKLRNSQFEQTVQRTQLNHTEMVEID
jgi:hypothetical protein